MAAMTKAQLHDYCRDVGKRDAEQRRYFTRNIWEAVAYAISRGDDLEEIRESLLQQARKLERGGPCHLRDYCAPSYRDVAARLPTVTIED